MLNVHNEQKRCLEREDIDPTQSILAQRVDPDQYPELTYLNRSLSKVKVYRDLEFGRHTPARYPQKADLPNDHLLPDANNLALVLNQLRKNVTAKKALLAAIQDIYEGATDIDVSFSGGTVQLYLQEQNYNIQSNRLSDGTLRYLCLLVILCHPDPPPLLCSEKPEIGLHPDMIVKITDLIKEYSKRAQVIITTHSDMIVDALSDSPDAIIVKEKCDSGTTFRRLDGQKLKLWLEEYSLGRALGEWQYWR